MNKSYSLASDHSNIEKIRERLRQHYLPFLEEFINQKMCTDSKLLKKYLNLKKLLLGEVRQTTTTFNLLSVAEGILYKIKQRIEFERSIQEDIDRINNQPIIDLIDDDTEMDRIEGSSSNKIIYQTSSPNRVLDLKKKQAELITLDSDDSESDCEFVEGDTTDSILRIRDLPDKDAIMDSPPSREYSEEDRHSIQTEIGGSDENEFLDIPQTREEYFEVDHRESIEIEDSPDEEEYLQSPKSLQTDEQDIIRSTSPILFVPEKPIDRSPTLIKQSNRIFNDTVTPETTHDSITTSTAEHDGLPAQDGDETSEEMEQVKEPWRPKPEIFGQRRKSYGDIESVLASTAFKGASSYVQPEDTSNDTRKNFNTVKEMKPAEKTKDNTPLNEVIGFSTVKERINKQTCLDLDAEKQLPLPTLKDTYNENNDESRSSPEGGKGFSIKEQMKSPVKPDKQNFMKKSKDNRRKSHSDSSKSESSDSDSDKETEKRILKKCKTVKTSYNITVTVIRAKEKSDDESSVEASPDKKKQNSLGRSKKLTRKRRNNSSTSNDSDSDIEEKIQKNFRKSHKRTSTVGDIGSTSKTKIQSDNESSIEKNPTTKSVKIELEDFNITGKRGRPSKKLKSSSEMSEKSLIASIPEKNKMEKEKSVFEELCGKEKIKSLLEYLEYKSQLAGKIEKEKIAEKPHESESVQTVEETHKPDFGGTTDKDNLNDIDPENLLDPLEVKRKRIYRKNNKKRASFCGTRVTTRSSKKMDLLLNDLTVKTEPIEGENSQN